MMVSVCLNGAFYLRDLYDVDITTLPPVDGQALIWSVGLGKWVPGNVSTGSASASEVYDFDGLSLALNDFVFLSPITEHFVLKAVDNNSVNPIIGIVTGFPSPTTVEVTHLGLIDIVGILTSGKKYILMKQDY